MRTTRTARLLSLLLLLTLPAAVQALDYEYTADNGAVTITKYIGPGGVVNIPQLIAGMTVVSIGQYAFSFSTTITSVTVPDTVTSIGYRAFFDSTRLTTVAVPNSVSTIGAGAFAFCTSLTTITVHPANFFYSSADGVLFNKNQTTLIQCPGGKAGSYTVPDAVANIGDSAFSSCAHLTSVTIGNNVNTIGASAFAYCNGLNSLSIGTGVSVIGSGAFASCPNLGAITVDVFNPFLRSVDGVLFNRSQSTLIQCPGGLSGSYAVTNTVASIAEYAFSGCGSLVSVSIPDSVTSIGDYAFSGCGDLESVTIPNTLPSIGNYLFSDCLSLTSVTIPDSVTSIGWGAFNACGSLATVVIGKNVTSIGDYTFAGCGDLTEIYFHGNAPDAGPYVFDSDYYTIVYYFAGTTGWDTTLAGRPTMLFNPQLRTSGAGFGVRTNRFGFNITGVSGMIVVVEACTDLANPIWTPLQTNTLTGGSAFFSDSQWTNYPSRFYRTRGQ